MNRKWLHFFVVFFSSALLASCSSVATRYCTRGDQPARDLYSTTKAFSTDGTQQLERGDVQCHVKKGLNGEMVKDGPYIEWYPNGQVSMRGEYQDGKKIGKWMEWDKAGVLISERWFDHGVETPTRANLAPKGQPSLQAPGAVSSLPSGNSSKR